MAIYIYDGVNKIHPAGWIGIRVYRATKSKGVMQHHFNCWDISQRQYKRYLREAKSLDREWAQIQLKDKQQPYKTLNPTDWVSDRTATEIRNIRIDWSAYFRDGYFYCYPRFQMQIMPAGKVITRQSHVRVDETIEEAWHRAIDFYADMRGLSRRARLELHKRTAPTEEQFNKLRLYKNRTYGYKIPKHKVPRSKWGRT